MDSIIKRIAIHRAVPKDVVEKVIEHSLELLVKKSKDCESLEVSGWGTFYFKRKAVAGYVKNLEKKVKKLKAHLLSLKDKSAIFKLEEKIRNVEREIERLKEKYEVE